MAEVSVKLGKIGPLWIRACTQAVKDLNLLFARKGIKVTLKVNGTGPIISVITDPGIVNLHGNYEAEYDQASGKLHHAEVRLAVKPKFSTPKGLRDAGPGVAEVTVAHEFVHALGHEPHTSHLMTDIMTPLDRAPGDKMQAGAVVMPPLQLSDESVKILQGFWK